MHIACEAGLMTNTRGATSLQLACFKGYLETAMKLVEFGADIHIADNKFWRALHYACAADNVDIALFLISKGANIFDKNYLGQKAFSLVKTSKVLEVL